MNVTTESPNKVEADHGVCHKNCKREFSAGTASQLNLALCPHVE